jgi:hypothetical protein
LLLAAVLCCAVLQGTLRQALDAGLLVNKATGCHFLPTVLSLAHNIACAMHYLHQVSNHHQVTP